MITSDKTLKIKPHPTLIKVLQNVTEDYDGFIIDLWGVIHDGIFAYPGAVECINHLISSNKIVMFMSNVPRPRDVVLDKLLSLNIKATPEMIITSGDIVRRIFDNQNNSSCRIKYYHLGSKRNTDILSGITVNLVEDIIEADTLLLTAYIDQDEDLAQHDTLLKKAATLKIPAICANPDKVVINGNKERYCAGVLAEKYELLGGKVYYYGKPHIDIYNVALQYFQDKGISNRERIVMIGDTLETDIQGAFNANIDSILVLTGNMDRLLKSNKFNQLTKHTALEQLFLEQQLQPTYILETLK